MTLVEDGDACHEEHQELSKAVSKVNKDLADLGAEFEVHAVEQHAQLMPRAEARSAIEEAKEAAFTAKSVAATNAANVSKILDEILGPFHPLSGERRTERGLSHKVDTIWRQSQNGGVQAKLTAPQKSAIWTAAIGGIAAILTAFVQLFG